MHRSVSPAARRSAKLAARRKLLPALLMQDTVLKTDPSRTSGKPNADVRSTDRDNPLFVGGNFTERTAREERTGWKGHGRPYDPSQIFGDLTPGGKPSGETEKPATESTPKPKPTGVGTFR